MPTFSTFDEIDARLATLAGPLAATAADHDRAASFPFGNFRLLKEAGLLALTVPRDHGGADADLATARRVIQAVASAEPSTALVLIMQYIFQRAIGTNPHWPEHLRAAVHRSAVEDGALINALRVEPELGTPARGGLPETIGRHVEGGWSISGRKLYATGFPGLTWLAVWGRTDEAEPRVGTFLIPKTADGIRVIEPWDHLGMRATGSHEVAFENVLIPADHGVDLRAPAAWATGVPLDTLAWMSVLIGSLYDSVARQARDWTVGFGRERKPTSLGAPLATLPRFQEAVGRIEALLLTNRLLIDDATARTDRGEPPSINESNLLKYTVTNNAVHAVEQALALSGNHGLSRHNPLERHYRDVLCGRVHTPQDDSVLGGLGRTAFADAALRHSA